MSNNLLIKDGAATDRTLKTTNAGGVHVPHHIVEGFISNPAATFTRPADTTAYTSGDLVANSTTAGSVVFSPITVCRVDGGSFMLRRVKLRKSSTSLTNAQFRVHFFRALPTTLTGDNGVFSITGAADYIGACDIVVDRGFNTASVGFGMPIVGSEMSVKLASGTDIFYVIEARAAYAPASAETFVIELDVLQN